MEYFNESTCIPIHLKTVQELANSEPKYEVCNNTMSRREIENIFKLSDPKKVL